jgi:hypothetical protein
MQKKFMSIDPHAVKNLAIMLATAGLWTITDSTMRNTIDTSGFRPILIDSTLIVITVVSGI